MMPIIDPQPPVDVFDQMSGELSGLGIVKVYVTDH